MTQVKPIITVKEARKLLGSDAAQMTNEELQVILEQMEQLSRLILRRYMVHKKAMVK